MKAVWAGLRFVARMGKRAAVLGVWSSAVLLVVSTLFQNKLIYHPGASGSNCEYVWHPSDWGLRNTESVFIESADGTRIHLLLVKTSQSNTLPVVILCQSNAGNIGHRLPKAASFVRTLGVNVCLLSYRGYGKSEGRPEERGMVEDALAAVSFVRRSTTVGNVVVLYGLSLGAAVAIRATVASQGTVQGLVIENGYTSIPDMAAALLPPLKPLFHSQSFNGGMLRVSGTANAT